MNLQTVLKNRGEKQVILVSPLSEERMACPASAVLTRMKARGAASLLWPVRMVIYKRTDNRPTSAIYFRGREALGPALLLWED